MRGIGAQRLLENTVSLPIAVWLEPICGRIVIELAAVLAGVSKVPEARHRVCGDRHGDVATTVELFDERVTMRIPVVEVSDDGYGPHVVDHERDQNITIGEETGGDHRL